MGSARGPLCVCVCVCVCVFLSNLLSLLHTPLLQPSLPFPLPPAFIVSYMCASVLGRLLSPLSPLSLFYSPFPSPILLFPPPSLSLSNQVDHFSKYKLVDEDSDEEEGGEGGGAGGGTIKKLKTVQVGP